MRHMFHAVPCASHLLPDQRQPSVLRFDIWPSVAATRRLLTDKKNAAQTRVGGGNVPNLLLLLFYRSGRRRRRRVGSMAIINHRTAGVEIRRNGIMDTRKRIPVTLNRYRRDRR